jgi:hypothetical protein
MKAFDSILAQLKRLAGKPQGVRGARQCAIAYKRGDQVYIHASSKTTSGVWILQPPVLAAAAQDNSGLGRCVAEAMDVSREGIPHPSSWAGAFDPILDVAGVASWDAFTDGVLCVGISVENGRMSFVPTKNLGPQQGFGYLKDKQIAISSTEPALFGLALVSSFAQSR